MTYLCKKLKMMNKKVILMILDGWGKSPDPKVSAIDNAKVPFINSLYQNYPSAQLRTESINSLYKNYPSAQLRTD
jgi:2,3-bisphosphoglycerate-independent phosphoglycerate mutase